ncbi:MAG: Maf family protein, partial [Firmicutes bacterium]|nr:Maf family protein [Bacillota bacterium]
MRIILASKSPRRVKLLKELIDEFEVIPSTINESSIKLVEKDPLKLVEKLAEIKAEDVFNKEQSKSGDLLVIGGDTAVYMDGEIYGKPHTKENAFIMLGKLQGRTNTVYTGLGIMVRVGNDVIREVYSSKTVVEMKAMSKEDIMEYIATGEPLDKAGAYAVQGIGAKYIKSI